MIVAWRSRCQQRQKEKLLKSHQVIKTLLARALYLTVENFSLLRTGLSCHETIFPDLIIFTALIEIKANVFCVWILYVPI